MLIENIVSKMIAGVFIAVYLMFCGSKLLKTKMPLRISSFVIIIALILFSAFSYSLFDNVIRMMLIYCLVLISYRIAYSKNISQCSASVLISYFLLCLGELVFTAGLMIFYNFNLVSDISGFQGSIIANIIICFIAFIIFEITKKYIIKIVERIKEGNIVFLTFTFVIVISAIGLFFYKIAINSWTFNGELAIDVLMIVLLIAIGLAIIKQEIDKSKISDEYERTLKYAVQSEKLLEQYSISQHENKNELIVIRSMVHKSNKKLLEYLNEIIKEKDNIEDAWIRYLRYIPFGGLKGIIHNKISEMKEQGINVFLDISREVGKSGLKDLTIKENAQLSKIIGVFLDNAREASIKSEGKKISILIYAENSDIVFEIANTYSGELDINQIYKVGLSTKGKNRGYGLPLVKSIIEENKMFENEPQIVDDCFVQKLRVKFSNKKRTKI